MDNNKPYNEFDEQFNDLPLPGEEQSWQKMKQMLDEDDRNRKPLVPIFLKSCAGWGLALLLIGTFTWFIVKPQKWWQDQKAATKSETKPGHNALYPGETNGSKPLENNHPDLDNNSPESKGNTTGGDHQITTTDQTGSQATAKTQVPSTISSNGSSQKQTTGNGGVITTRGTTNPGRDVSRVQANKPGAHANPSTKAGSMPSDNKGVPVDGMGIPGKTVIVGNPAASVTKPGTESPLTTSKKSLHNDTVVKKDNITAADSVSIKEPSKPADTAAVVQKQENKSKKTKLVISAGIGLQQQIPIGGQQAVPYDYYGRTGSVSDYIPSVYLRVGKENKWFVQGEFRYGAPQTLKDFQYSRQTKVDSQAMTVTTYRLKKTYYHQLPFSFNYYILPNLTVGIGGIYNRFYGAVTEKEVKKTDLQTQVETLSREIVNIQHFNDSFLYKTQVHGLVQTEYHWKRFDFGLRYTKDIQPYIKYTQPDGKIDVKKNQTFQLLVRYRIWQSGK